MPHSANFEIHINGQAVGKEFITRLSLSQEYNEHSRFELEVYSDRSGDAEMFTHQKAQDLLGKEISIALTEEEKSANNTFKGIFTTLTFASNYGHAQESVILGGYGKTIQLDSGQTNSSYLEQKIGDVVKKLLDSTGLSSSVSASSTEKLPYITQYGESNFEFIRRLAAEYGEPFYDDGTKIHFGKTGKGAEVSLSYPADLSACSLRVKLLPTNTEQSIYLSKEAKKQASDSKSVSAPGLDAFGKAALSKSGEIFKLLPRTLSPRKTLTMSGLQDAVKVAKQRATSSLTVLEAASDSPFVRIGAIVNITAPGISGSKYVVTSVQHSFDGGVYSNRFEAVPENIDVIPSPYYHKPVAESQTGVVINNKDPENLGRVQVELLWHKDGEKTPWIRVLRPDGGGSAKNRGFYFIPEIDDIVIVGFTQNDPDRPFVMGALPTGKVSDTAKYGDKNDYRSISTRSGAIISFEDKSDTNEIRVELDGGNYLSIQKKGSDGTIKIYSTKAIEVNSKDSILIQGDKTVTVKSEKIAIEATDTISLKANKKIEIKAPDVAIEASKGLEAKAGAAAKIQGMQVEVAGSTKTSVKGNVQLELQGGAMTTLKGGIVQIN